MSLLLLFRPRSGGSSGALAGSCDLTFGAGSSSLKGTSALTATNAAAMVFGHGSSAIGGAAELRPDLGLGSRMTFGTLVLYMDGGGALVGTNAAAMIFGHNAVISFEQAFELPILVMARSLA